MRSRFRSGEFALAPVTAAEFVTACMQMHILFSNNCNSGLHVPSWLKGGRSSNGRVSQMTINSISQHVVLIAVEVSGFFAPSPFRPLDDSPPGFIAARQRRRRRREMVRSRWKSIFAIARRM